MFRTREEEAGENIQVDLLHRKKEEEEEMLLFHSCDSMKAYQVRQLTSLSSYTYHYISA